MKNFRRLGRGLILIFISSSLYAGEYDAEIAKHQELIAQDPSDLDAACQLGNYLAWDGRYDEALQVYQKVLEQKSGYPDAEMGMARTYAWRGDQEHAVKKYGEILAADPKNFEAYQGLGSLALWINDFENAIIYFKKALEINSEDVVSLKGMGRAYLGRGDRQHAEDYFTQAQILEIKKKPLFLIGGIGGGGLVALLVFLFVRSRIRSHKKEILLLELKILRYALALYQQKTGKRPLALEGLFDEKWIPSGFSEERPYLEGFRRGDRGFLYDPFGKRYRYNPDTGGINSLVKGCEQW